MAPISFAVVAIHLERAQLERSKSPLFIYRFFLAALLDEVQDESLPTIYETNLVQIVIRARNPRLIAPNDSRNKQLVATIILVGGEGEEDDANFSLKEALYKYFGKLLFSHLPASIKFDFAFAAR